MLRVEALVKNTRPCKARNEFQKTFCGWSGILLRSGTGRWLPVHSRQREATRYRWIDSDSITYSETLATISARIMTKINSRNFFQKPFGLR